MTLRREEAQTTGRHARVSFSVTVICCDHRGDNGRCDGAYFVGIGEGDDLPDDAVRDAEELGWAIGSLDYCPDHAPAHVEDEARS